MAHVSDCYNSLEEITVVLSMTSIVIANYTYTFKIKINTLCGMQHWVGLSSCGHASYRHPFLLGLETLLNAIFAPNFLLDMCYNLRLIFLVVCYMM